MVETLDEILRKALEYHGSDVFVVPGSQIMTKANGTTKIVKVIK